MVGSGITYSPECRMDMSKVEHIVSIDELEDGDLVPVGTLIVPIWYAWGTA